MLVGEYWIATKKDGEKSVHIGEFFKERTLCGKWNDTMKIGDETASGFAATCRTCKSVFDRRIKEDARA